MAKAAISHDDLKSKRTNDGKDFDVGKVAKSLKLTYLEVKNAESRKMQQTYTMSSTKLNSCVLTYLADNDIFSDNLQSKHQAKISRNGWNSESIDIKTERYLFSEETDGLFRIIINHLTEEIEKRTITHENFSPSNKNAYVQALTRFNLEIPETLKLKIYYCDDHFSVFTLVGPNDFIRRYVAFIKACKKAESDLSTMSTDLLHTADKTTNNNLPNPETETLRTLSEHHNKRLNSKVEKQNLVNDGISDTKVTEPKDTERSNQKLTREESFTDNSSVDCDNQRNEDSVRSKLIDTKSSFGNERAATARKNSNLDHCVEEDAHASIDYCRKQVSNTTEKQDFKNDSLDENTKKVELTDATNTYMVTAQASLNNSHGELERDKYKDTKPKLINVESTSGKQREDRESLSIPLDFEIYDLFKHTDYDIICQKTLKFDEVLLHRNKDSAEFKIVGLHEQLMSAKQKITKDIAGISKFSTNFDSQICRWIGDSQILKDYIKSVMIEKKLYKQTFLKYRQGRIDGISLTKNAAGISKQILENCIVNTPLSIIKANKDVMDTNEWKSILNNPKFKDRCRIVMIEDSGLNLVATNDIAAECSSALQQCIDAWKPYLIEYFVGFDKLITEYMNKFLMIDIGNAYAFQKDFSVSCESNDTKSGYRVRGCEKDVEHFKNTISKYSRTIHQISIPVINQGESDYFDSLQGKGWLSELGDGNNCLLKFSSSKRKKTAITKPLRIEMTFQFRDHLKVYVATTTSEIPDDGTFILPMVSKEDMDPFVKSIIDSFHSKTQVEIWSQQQTLSDCKYIRFRNRPKNGCILVPSPKWKGESTKSKENKAQLFGNKAAKDAVSKLWDSAMQLADVQQKTTAYLPLLLSNKWPARKSVKHIVTAVQGSLEQLEHINAVYFCLPSYTSPAELKSMNDTIEEVFKGQPQIKNSFSRADISADQTSISTPKNIKIKVVEGQLASQKNIDVLVNSSNPQLELFNGAISKSLLGACGESLQSYCNALYPSGINYGEVAVTGAGKLKETKAIFHGAFARVSSDSHGKKNLDSLLQVLQAFVDTCLNKAGEYEFKSIAFPALCTGVLGYPPDLVARAMFQSVQLFDEIHPNTTVKTVNFVLYPADKMTLEAFKFEEQKMLNGYASFDNYVTDEPSGTIFEKKFGKVTCQIMCDDVRKMKAQGLICLWPAFSKGQLSSPQLLLDAKIEKQKLGKLKTSLENGYSESESGCLNYSVILHHSVSFNLPINKALSVCLSHADERRLLSVVVDITPAVIKDTLSVKKLIQAMEDFRHHVTESRPIEYLEIVKIVMNDKDDFNDFIGRLMDLKEKSMCGLFSKSNDWTMIERQTNSRIDIIYQKEEEKEAVKETIFQHAKQILTEGKDETEEGFDVINEKDIPEWEIHANSRHKPLKRAHSDVNETQATASDDYRSKGARPKTIQRSNSDCTSQPLPEKFTKFSGEISNLIETDDSKQYNLSLPEKDRNKVIINIHEDLDDFTLVNSINSIKVKPSKYVRPFEEKNQALLVYDSSEDAKTAVKYLEEKKYNPKFLDPPIFYDIKAELNPCIYIEACKRNKDKDLLKILKKQTGVIMQPSTSSISMQGCAQQIDAAILVIKRFIGHSQDLLQPQANQMSQQDDEKIINIGCVTNSQLDLALHFDCIFLKALTACHLLAIERLEAGTANILCATKNAPFMKKLLDDDLKRLETINTATLDISSSLISRATELAKEFNGHYKAVYVGIFEEKSMATFYSSDWTKLDLIKKKFNFKLGNSSTTETRRGRQFTVDDSKNLESENSTQSVAQQEQHDNEIAVMSTGVKILAYKADITKLHNVDAIVNAANKEMKHGGGVAGAIVKEGGDIIQKESDDFTRKNGNVSVGDACVTTAGRLPCKFVIHSVGPRWIDYRYNKKAECLGDLFRAVRVCFIKGCEYGLNSIAVSSISSGIYGVDKHDCAKVYAHATRYFFEKENLNTSLKEIHFVDIDNYMLSLIKSEFESNSAILNPKDHQPYLQENITDIQVASQMPLPDIHTTGSQEMKSSLQQAFDSKPTKSRRILKGSIEAREYKIFNKTALVYTGDLTEVDVDCIVIGWKKNGDGVLQKMVEKKGGACYKKDVADMNLTGDKPQGFTFITIGGSLSCNLIAHLVCPGFDPKNSGTFNRDFRSCLQNVFNEISCYKDNISSIALPLLCTGKGNAPVEQAVNILCNQVAVELQKPGSSVKEIHLVSHESSSFYVMKSNMEDIYDDLVTRYLAIQDSPLPSPDAEHFSEKTDPKEKCVICMDTITNTKKLNKCGHTFCKTCIDDCFKVKPVCPVCGKIYGVVLGDQPEGKMKVTPCSYKHLSGYSKHVGTIEIRYSFPDGKQGENHPSPGSRYKGTTRTAYLPDNTEGRKILKLLEVAFERKLVFTIGNSRTLAVDNIVTWNDIHHKTSEHGGPENFGYPDKTYLQRVREELAAKGVTEESIKQNEDAGHFNASQYTSQQYSKFYR